MAAVPGALALPQDADQPIHIRADAAEMDQGSDQIVYRGAVRVDQGTLRVDADVPGANVFLDRKFLGTTPVETRDFEPGPHRINASAEGYEMYGESVELAPGENTLTIRFKEVRLDERLDGVHKHGMGSCHGRLVATPADLRYEAEKSRDSFDATFASLEPLQVDYLNRNLRVKQKGGKTWNLTADSADALLAFQKNLLRSRSTERC